MQSIKNPNNIWHLVFTVRWLLSSLCTLEFRLNYFINEITRTGISCSTSKVEKNGDIFIIPNGVGLMLLKITSNVIFIDDREVNGMRLYGRFGRDMLYRLILFSYFIIQRMHSHYRLLSIYNVFA